MLEVDSAISVLVVDDEPLISLDLCDTLMEAGYHVIGPALSMADALSLLDQKTPGLAVIDLKTRNEFCSGLARQLRMRNVPFVIHTGYPPDDADDVELRHAPRLEKPASPFELLKALSELSALSVQDGQSPATSDKTASFQALMSGTMR